MRRTWRSVGIGWLELELGIRELRLIFRAWLVSETIVVNIVRSFGLPRWQYLCTANNRVVLRPMWIPTTVYEKFPQLWLLIGLMFISAGLYIGFEYVLTIYYVGLGLACCGYGIGIHVLRLRNRQSKDTRTEASRDEADGDDSVGIQH